MNLTIIVLVLSFILFVNMITEYFGYSFLNPIAEMCLTVVTLTLFMIS